MSRAVLLHMNHIAAIELMVDSQWIYVTTLPDLLRLNLEKG
jgi:hypothetical protein